METEKKQYSQEDISVDTPDVGAEKLSDSDSKDNDSKHLTKVEEENLNHYNKIYERLGRTGNANRSALDSSDDVQYVLDKAKGLSVNESLEILRKTLDEHSNDLNFPEASREIIRDLVNSPEKFEDGEFEFEVKSEAAIIKYFSPYAEVRAVTSPIDDPAIPSETIRSYVLGLIWSVIGQFINSFFNSRYPTITITSPVCQTLIYPCGKLWELIIPDWGFNFRGHRISLNPGPWNFKEQMLSTIMFDVSLTSAYAFSNIQTQEMYFNDKWLTAGYKILLLLSTQCMGLGFAGVLRRFVVYPVEALWPTQLPTLALNRALLLPDLREKVHGWRISKYKFFFIVFAVSFIYYWFPGYIFQALSYFAWMSWIKPDNFNLATVTGDDFGLAYNPISSFDWNIVGNFHPLAVPFFSYVQQYIGTFISGLIILAVYYTNTKNTAYLPINSSGIFDNTGMSYEVEKVITDGRLDLEKYKKYSPPFYTAANLVVYGAFFLTYPLVFVYVLLDQWKIIGKAFGDIRTLIVGAVMHIVNKTKDAFKSLGHGDILGFFKNLGGIFVEDGSVYDGFDDPFTRAISKYPEVPNWWFYIIVVISFIFAIILLTQYSLNTPVWTIFFVIAINFVFLIPMNLMSAITGATVGLNVIVELVIGYAVPGSAEALMFVKAYGYNIDGQASTYISDQKMGHYARIPPRAVFRAQILSTIVTAFICYAVVDFVDNNVENICQPDQKEHFTCANGSQIYYSAAVLWGLVGPKRVFSQQYPELKWMFLAGFLLSLVWWGIKNYGYVVRDWTQKKFAPAIYSVLNWTIYKPLYLLREVHPALISIGFLEWAPLNLAYQTGGLYLSIAFMYYIRRHMTSWWEKYNYVLSAGLDAGLAFSAIIVFFAVQYHEKDISWWGNNIVAEGVDGYAGQSALKTELPEKGYFGPDTWN